MADFKTLFAHAQRCFDQARTSQSRAFANVLNQEGRYYWQQALEARARHVRNTRSRLDGWRDWVLPKFWG